jgi:two-component system CheB/CheR fusion protein
MPPLRQRPSGIRSVGDLPGGTHFCVLYSSPRELLDAVVPFVAAGLESGALCSWEVRAPLTAEEATAALAAVVPDLAEHVARGRLELFAPGEGTPRADGELERTLDRAILAGFDGLRVVRHAPAEEEGRAIAAAVEDLGRLDVLAAVLVPRDLGVVGLMDRVQEHRFALVCDAGRWEVLKGSAARVASAALRRSEARLQTLFGQMSEGFAYCRIVLDAQGKPCDFIYLEVSPSFERLTGLAAREVLGKRATQVSPGIARAPFDWIGSYGRVALTGEPIRFESRSPRTDGWFAVSAFSPRPGYFAITFSDVTDRRRAEAERLAAEDQLRVTLRGVTASEQALRASEARLKLLSDSASLLLSTDDPQGVVSRLCRGVMEHLDCQVFFNYLSDPATGTLRLNAWAGIPDEEARRIGRLAYGVAVCGCVARDGQRMVAEDLRHNPDPRADLVRSYGVLAYCCHPLVAGGTILGTLSFGTRTRPHFSGEEVALMKTVADQVAVAMERIRSQRALHEANARLQEADRRKDEFIAVLSHELRNPLAPIQNSLHILDRAPPGGDQARRSMEVIRRQATHLARLVEDLLDVTRIANGKILLQRQRVDFCEVALKTVEDHLGSFSLAGVRLEKSLPGGALWVHADPTRLAQIVGNLLGNALKFTPRGGAVRLTLAVEQGSARLGVRDDGVGIAPEVLDRLFRPFSQADQTLDRSRGGLGLGLALVKGLAELHGGSASAASGGLGRGAEFTVTLPLEAAPPAAERAPSPRPARGHRVLVIDDNVESADTLRELLTLSGHEVRSAYDGAVGIAAAREFRPEVVLCDIGLPGISGYAVAQALRADPSLGGTYLVALSGYAHPDDVARAHEAGFDRHVAKPPALETLEEVFAAREAAAS